ncbi:unnamed protein product, partial [Ectocarpus sp. 8 AP-2014]
THKTLKLSQNRRNAPNGNPINLSQIGSARALTTTYHTQKIKRQETDNSAGSQHTRRRHACSYPRGFQLRGLTGGLESPPPPPRSSPPFYNYEAEKGVTFLPPLAPLLGRRRRPPRLKYCFGSLGCSIL